MKEFNFFRHGNADYKEYQKIKESENPQASFDDKKQEDLDLTDSGRELAENQASVFFDSINPEQTKLFFVSSNEARAMETADIFKRVAKSKGFEIITPENTRSAFVDNFTDGQIRVIDTLSINPKNILMGVSIFNSGFQDTSKFFDQLDNDTQKKWKYVRNIIDTNDKGSWAKNYKEYGNLVKELLPKEVKTVEDLYENNFKNIKRLIKWADKKIQESGQKITIMGFGHEDYMLQFLENEFQEEGIKNCEMINFLSEEGSITANFRNKKVSLDSEEKDMSSVLKKAA